MSRTIAARLYQKGGRWYGDFRDFADVGGRQTALVPVGGARATEDRALAVDLATRRLEELVEQRRRAARTGAGGAASPLGHVARLFITEERRRIDEGEEVALTPRWLDDVARHLERAVGFFGASKPLDAIRPADVLRWLQALRRTVDGRGGALSGTAQRKHLYALSKLYEFAKFEELAERNPVRDIPRKQRPRERSDEARFLEVPEAARLLEAARRVASKRPDLACPFLPELLATYLLTGGRRTEVLGLMAEDVSLERRTVTFRPNRYRRLKTPKSRRVVPLWPQLEATLGPYLMPPDRTPRTGLLFPGAAADGTPQLLTDFRKALAVAVTAAKLEGPVTPKVFRHTYTAARLQTLDGGHPIAKWTVIEELGHGSERMVDEVYGHLGRARHRASVVEYRLAPDPGNILPVTGDPAPSSNSLSRP